MAVKSFTIYEEYFDLITLLDREEQKELIISIFEYMFNDKKPCLNESQMKIFKNLKRPLDISKNNSERRAKVKPKENQKETEKKPNQNQNNNQKKTHQDVIVVVNKEININTIINFIENNFNRTISSYELEQIEILIKDYTSEVVLYAFKKTLEAGKSSLNYTKGILKNWKQDNLRTLEDIKAQEIKKDEPVEEMFEYDWLNGEE